MQKVLFLGHDATRTGAPLLLLELIRWLGTHSAIKPSVLLKRGGEIESDYRAIAPTKCLHRGFYRLLPRKLRYSAIWHSSLAAPYPAKEYPVVYANTIATCDLAVRLAGGRRHLVHHIHELAYGTGSFGMTETLQRAVPITDAYIAASHAVRQYLEAMIGVPPAKIHVIHEFPIAVGRNHSPNETRRTRRRELGIPDDVFVIGMCGWPEFRKGTDLFAQLALYVNRRLAPAQCHFVWLGGDARSHREALHDVAQIGLRERCHFLPAVPDPEACFSMFDLYALTSREDPFSVAMLEAAAIGLPIVCFASGGGAPELVENDAGIVVPYLDVAAMAQACVDLLSDEKRRRELGDNARAKVRARYLLDVQGPKILAVLELVTQPAR